MKYVNYGVYTDVEIGVCIARNEGAVDSTNKCLEDHSGEQVISLLGVQRYYDT